MPGGGRAFLVLAAVLMAACTVPTPPNPTGQQDPDPFAAGAVQYPGDRGDPTLVRWYDEDGSPVDVMAHPGFVTFWAEPRTRSGSMDVESAVEEVHGILVSSLPIIHLYEAKVEPGYEWSFGQGLRDHDRIDVSEIQPTQALETRAGGFTSHHVAEYRGVGDVLLFDDFDTPLTDCEGTTHGGLTQTIVETRNEGKEDLTAPDVTATGVSSPWNTFTLSHNLAKAAEAARQDDSIRVVSLSLGAAVPDQYQSPRNCNTPECAEMARRQYHAQADFLESVYRTVQNLPPETRDHIVVTVAAGNEGLDLTTEMDFLRKVFPDAHPRVLAVGGSKPDGTPEPAFNTGRGGASDMVFAQGVGVQRDVPPRLQTEEQAALGGDYPCINDGTSFATPQLARMIAQLLKDVGGLTGPEAIEAIRQACELVELPPTASLGAGSMPTSWCEMPTYEKAKAAAIRIVLGLTSTMSPTPATTSRTSAPTTTSRTTTPPTTSAPIEEHYYGEFSGNLGTLAGNSGCQWSLPYEGSMDLWVTRQGNGAVTGTGQSEITVTFVITATGSETCTDGTVSGFNSGSVTGTTSNVAVSWNSGGTRPYTMAFNGPWSGTSVLGTASVSRLMGTTSTCCGDTEETKSASGSLTLNIV
jgi:subtilase family protein